MAAKNGESRTDTEVCKGLTKSGEPCRCYVGEGEEFCHHHRAQNEHADIVSISDRLRELEPADVETRAERMEWLDRVRRGLEGEFKVSPRGDVVEVPASMKERLTAANLLERMMRVEENTNAEGSFRRAVEDVVDDILG